MKLIILWLFIMVIGACNDQVNKKETSKIESGSDTTGRHSTVNTGDDGAGVLPLAPEADLYSIQVPGATISLQQWDSTLNLKQLLGEPIKQKTKKLDSNSDTHAGSYIKDMEFKGLRLKLFSPPQNGKHFWILEMILTGNKYKTTNDVTIGDQFEKVKKSVSDA